MISWRVRRPLVDIASPFGGHCFLCKNIPTGLFFIQGIVRTSRSFSPRGAEDTEKSDEGIQGDGHFVKSVLAGAREAMEEKYRLKGLGDDLETIGTWVSRIFDVTEARIRSSGKEPERVKAKSVTACWALRELAWRERRWARNWV
jgi:hypothetical protein